MITGRQLVYIIFFLLYYVPAVGFALLVLAPLTWGIITLAGIAFMWLLFRGIPATRKAFDKFLEEVDEYGG